MDRRAYWWEAALSQACARSRCMPAVCQDPVRHTHATSAGRHLRCMQLELAGPYHSDHGTRGGACEVDVDVAAEGLVSVSKCIRGDAQLHTGQGLATDQWECLCTARPGQARDQGHLHTKPGYEQATTSQAGAALQRCCDDAVCRCVDQCRRMLWAGWGCRARTLGDEACRQLSRGCGSKAAGAVLQPQARSAASGHHGGCMGAFALTAKVSRGYISAQDACRLQA